MARTRWTPESATDEQERLIEAAESAARQAERWDQATYDAIAAAQTAKVPITYLAKRTGRSRADVYRHFAIPSTDAAGDRDAGVLADLPAEKRAKVAGLFAEKAWTTTEFLLACFDRLLADPRLLDRLEEFRPPRKRGRSKTAKD